MHCSLQDKSAIVTGGSRGIGREIATELGKLGASVVLTYLNNAERAEEVVGTIKEAGGRCLAVKADMKKLAAVVSVFDMTVDLFGSLDILINNAGTFLHKPIEQVTEKEYDNIFNTNVKGLFFACQQAARKMADGGRIINISSSVTRVMMPGYGAYGASKGAVEQITRVLAKELGHRRITVNAISPGPVDTELFRQGKSAEQIGLMAEMAALGRIGTPGDIADVVKLLVSEQANWITGQNVCANGGFAA